LPTLLDSSFSLLAFLESLFLIALLFFPARLLAIRSFRLRIGVPASVLASLVVVLCVGIIILLALYLPVALHVIFFISLGFTTFLVWRARPSYGKSNNLPPGTLALFPVGPWRDQAFYERKFEKYGAIFKTSDLFRPSVCILGIAPARDFLQHNTAALRVPPFGFSRLTPGGILRFAEPAAHAKYRPILQAALAPGTYIQLKPALLDTTRRCLADMLASSSASPDGISPKPYIRELLFLQLVRLFFGISPDDDAFSPFKSHFLALARVRFAPFGDATARQALDDLTQRIRDHPETTPCFTSVLSQQHPCALDDPILINNLIFTMRLAWNDLTGLIMWLLKMLADHPDWLARIRALDSDPELPRRIVLETLRLQQSEFLIRRTTQDLEFEGFRIPARWHIRICIRESHRRSPHFQDPTEFNPDRFLQQRISRTQFMPFGTLTKSCLGEQLTMHLAADFLTELARSCDLALLHDGPPAYNGMHWEPSPALRLRLTAPPQPSHPPTPRESGLPDC
jgi:cytochrome P450